jgi:catechol 2,3-dioxygenase-like lactoylglutathione lyase family enzyme
MAQIVSYWSVLAVRDLELSTRYYIDVLGFTKEPIHGEGWSFLTRGAFRVMLGECRDEKPAGELGNHSYYAYWNIDHVDEFYEEIVAKGALVTSKPTTKPWGLREFAMKTPDGHRITCGETIRRD